MSVLLCGGDRPSPPSSLDPRLAGLHSLLHSMSLLSPSVSLLTQRPRRPGHGENCLITTRAFAGRTPAQSIRAETPTGDDGAAAGLSRDVLRVASQSQARLFVEHVVPREGEPDVGARPQARSVRRVGVN